MTREEHKEYNAENYPASVLSWLNEAIDRVFDDFESRTCNNCKLYKCNYKKCDNEASIAFTSQEAIYHDDLCNKWEMRK